jgi:hypothetical protein
MNAIAQNRVVIQAASGANSPSLHPGKDWAYNSKRERLFEMTGNTKRKTLLLLGLIIVFTMTFAANLPHLEFQPGMPLPRLQEGRVVAESVEKARSVSISSIKFILVLIALVLSGAMLYSMYQLIRGANWKIIADSLRYALIISVGVGFFVFLIMFFPSADIDTPIEIPIPTPEPVVTSPLGSAPPLVLWLVGIGLLVISILVVVWIVTPSRQTSPIDLVGLEAEKARAALKTGVGLKDVILNCYLQMCLALKQEQGIERKDFMTTGEFEGLLESSGIPHEPVHQLTQLFDAVRYGNWQPNDTDEQMAIQCLESIMAYSRESELK